MLPKRVRRRCPAIIFAANRTARVPGRITFLTVSIKTMKGIKGPGVPEGTRWANMCWVWCTQPKIINDSQRGRARVKVMARCLVLVNTYGRSPRELLKTINLNKLTKIIVPPGLLGPKSVLNSLCNVVVIMAQSKDHRDGMNQNK